MYTPCSFLGNNVLYIFSANFKLTVCSITIRIFKFCCARRSLCSMNTLLKFTNDISFVILTLVFLDAKSSHFNILFNRLYIRLHILFKAVFNYRVCKIGRTYFIICILQPVTFVWISIIYNTG